MNTKSRIVEQFVNESVTLDDIREIGRKTRERRSNQTDKSISVFDSIADKLSSYPTNVTINKYDGGERWISVPLKDSHHVDEALKEAGLIQKSTEEKNLFDTSYYRKEAGVEIERIDDRKEKTVSLCVYSPTGEN